MGALAETLLLPSGIEGVYARTAVSRSRHAPCGLHLAPPRAGNRGVAVPAGNEPPAIGAIGLSEKLSAFSRLRLLPNGGDAEIRGTVEPSKPAKIGRALCAADLVLTPAACYPVYPLVASRGDVPAAGLLFDVASDCFRREPSRDLDRLQSFRMREYVCIGTPEQIDDFRERWMARAQDVAGQLGLPYRSSRRATRSSAAAAS